jgi:hypothetical protein
MQQAMCSLSTHLTMQLHYLSAVEILYESAIVYFWLDTMLVSVSLSKRH